MIGVILTTILVYTIVATYIFIVNRMLRTDKHWRESDMVKRTVKPEAAADYAVAPVAAHA